MLTELLSIIFYAKQLTFAAQKDKLMPQTPSLPPQPITPDLVKQIAMDIGKAVAHHIERMYPRAVDATSKTMLLSVRNCTYNEIIAALNTTDVDAIVARLAERKLHRRQMNAMARSGEELGRQREANPPQSHDEAII